jgi:hypothetical protein
MEHDPSEIECETDPLSPKRVGKLCSIFNIPSNQTLAGGTPVANIHCNTTEYLCNIRKIIFKCPGKLYIFSDYICFYSNLMGIKTIEVIPIAGILTITKTWAHIIIKTETKKVLDLGSTSKVIACNNIFDFQEGYL